MDYKFSPFTHFADINQETVAIFNSLNLKKLFLKKERLEYIRKSLKSPGKNSKLLDTMISNQFIVPKNRTSEQIMQEFMKKRKIVLGKTNFRVFYIIPTTGCNFRCSYCYLSRFIDYKPRVMSIEKADQILEFLFRYMSTPGKKNKVVIYGGEPLLNRKVVAHTASRIREQESEGRIGETEIILITNGTLIDNEICRIIKKNKMLVAVSLDGPEKIHNKARVYRDNRGTFKEVMKGIKILNKNDIKPTISCTISMSNVDGLESFAEWITNNAEVESIGMNLMSGADFSKKEIQDLSIKSAKKIIDVFKICREKGIYEDTVLRQMRAFVEEQPHVFNCAATSQEIAVDPDGNMAACPGLLKTKEFPFSLENCKNPENTDKFKEWARRSPFSMRECWNCVALGICGGGCAYNALENKGTIFSKDEFFCNYAKNLVYWMLKDLHEKIVKRRSSD